MANRLTPVLCLLLFAALCVKASAQQERLTVFIAIDELNEHAVKNFWDSAEPQCITFGHKVYGGVESLVTMLSGVDPQYHGVAHDIFFDAVTHKMTPVLSPNGSESIGAPDIMSPRNILSPTLPDMLKMSSRLNKVYAVGLNAQYTMALAGHDANAALWLNNRSLQWAASKYFGEGLPAAADQMNVSKEIETRAQNIWRPSLDSLALYSVISDKEAVDHGFAYYCSGKDKNGVALFDRTPFANQLVLDMALTLQHEHKLGVYTNDMLLLQLTSVTPASKSSRVVSAEQEDMYRTLWEQIIAFSDSLASLTDKPIDIFISGIPGRGEDLGSLEKLGFSHGQFNIERAAALVNTYLMAIYGHHPWIEGANANALIVNRKLLAEQKINYNDFTQQVAHFLENFEGVNKAYTLGQITASCDDNTESAEIRNSLSKRFAGDVYVTLQPGWQLANNSTTLDRYHAIKASVPAVHIHNNSIKVLNVNNATGLLPAICSIINIELIK